MLRGRARIPVLAEFSGPADGRAWALRREDHDALTQLLPPLAEREVVAVAGEGETTAVAALAAAAAASASGRRTILVDCDLARPRLAAHVGLAAAPGLHEYLRWEAGPQGILQPLALAGAATADATDPLVCICGGRPASKAETLLGLQSFAHMIGKLRVAYELTLLLAPPVESEPGAARAVAMRADAALAALPGDQVKGRVGRPLRRTITRLPVPTMGALALRAPSWVQRS
jgi:succinoglycan biosynthesis transport protein ExoP